MKDHRFNLLPHRQIARGRALRVFLRQAAACVLSALACAIVGLILIKTRISGASAFNQELAIAIEAKLPSYEESRRLHGQYQQMLKRQNLIEGLDARRSTTVLLMNDVADALPREIYLLRIEEDGVVFRVEGRSAEASAIARFLERLSSSLYLKDIILGEVKTQDPDSSAPYLFSLEGTVRLANDVVSVDPDRRRAR
ncbi:MAG: PilN domain-containing protein [Rhodocyclaceae bacterium]|nr:PilN domain-containing protein [Rhodocyclaceae bacterium]